jgi:UDP-N-acetylglucosamine acyltransferase
MSKISPLASVDPNACVADDVEVGPFCLIGPGVTLGPRNRLLSHVVITGNTKIGAGNTFHPHCVIGGPPQDLTYKGELTGLEIGNDNTFREAVTVNVGTNKGAGIHGGGVTRIGNNNLLMVNVHVAHDVQIGNHTILSNNTMLSGHVVIGDRAILLGLVGVHQFVSIGELAYLGGGARIHHDVPPFVKVSDDDQIRALNETGLKRAGYLPEDIEALDQVLRALFLNKKKPFAKALADFDTMNGINPHVKTMVEFLRRRDSGKYGRYLEGLRVAK